MAQSLWLWRGALACVLLWSVLSAGCHRRPEVIVYAAQDQVYAEPILENFTAQTGIRVRAVYDSEAAKTVGLANRLLAEQARPKCDLFWGNEELRTRQLAARGVFRSTNGWAAFGFRSRRMVINTNKLTALLAPQTLRDLTNVTWRGRVALAYPLFGTTATHFLALRQHWGEGNWLVWCRALQGNRPLLVDGNSLVVRLVARGEAWIGLTDSDDIAAGQREGEPVMALPLNDESLLIPNTVAVIQDAPHPEAAEALFQYLRKPEVGERLVAVHALEGMVGDPATGAVLKPDWPALLLQLDVAMAQLDTIFLRN